MKILVTGAAGFIGRRLVQTLQDNHEVFAIARSVPADHDRVSWIAQDLALPLNITALPAKIDAIVHLAQSRFYRQFPEKSKDIFDVNVQSTFQLLEYARQAGADRFVYASSGGIYGFSSEKFVENDPVSTINFYLSSKYISELLIANYKHLFTTIVLRLFFVYGPGQQAMLVPSLFKKVLNGDEVLIEGNPGCRLNPIYVDDAVRAFIPTLNYKHSELFNIAGDEVISITDIVHAIGHVTSKKTIIKYISAKQAGDLIADNARMKSVLGISPRVSFQDGLKKMMV